MPSKPAKERSTSDSYPQDQQNKDWVEKARGARTKAFLRDSGEDIANIMEDIRKGRLKFHRDKRLAAMAYESVHGVETVIDATAIYNDMISQTKLGKPIFFYEDHPAIILPWEHAAIAYQNDHGNIIVMDCNMRETDRTEQWKVERRFQDDEEVDPDVEWERVRWVTDVFLWLGGQTNAGDRVETFGPVHMWRLAIYEDGEPADLSWVQLQPEYPMEFWDMAHATLLGCLNFLNCRNVEIVEPERARPVRRRIERTGVTVKTLSVFAIGKSTRSQNGEPGAKGTPLTSVRGHFAKYGPQFDRKLLFGKYEGQYWIPQHARGDSAYGINQNDYRIETESDDGV